MRAIAAARGMSIASDVAFRMPSLWFAEGHGQVAPVYLYRFDWSTPMMKLLLVGAAHATELPYVWGTLRFPGLLAEIGRCQVGQGGLRRIRARWVNFATHGKPLGLPDEPYWMPYQKRIDPAWSSTVTTGSSRTSTRTSERPGAATPCTSADALRAVRVPRNGLS